MIVKNKKEFYLFLLNERLHVNNVIDKYADEIYDKISSVSFYIDKNLPEELLINQITYRILKLPINVNGQLNINKCKLLDNGKWNIHIDLTKDFSLSTLKHELNHALSLSMQGKDKMLNHLSYINSNNLFKKYNNDEINEFFSVLYFASNEEINAKVIETYNELKELNNIKTNNDFNYALKQTDGYKLAIYLEHFNVKNNFKSFTKQDIDKFFYILDEEQNNLNRIYKSKFMTLKLFIKNIKNLFINNMLTYSVDDNFIYKPIKNDEFYTKFINKQGLRLKTRLHKLFDHI